LRRTTAAGTHQHGTWTEAFLRADEEDVAAVEVLHRVFRHRKGSGIARRRAQAHLDAFAHHEPISRLRRHHDHRRGTRYLSRSA
jgi:hypothetical protein